MPYTSRVGYSGSFSGFKSHTTSGEDPLVPFEDFPPVYKKNNPILKEGLYIRAGIDCLFIYGTS